MAVSISVVIPSFNFGRYLAEAVQSALSQTRPALEVIVVDDCSTDDSVEVARTLGVTVLSTRANSGVAAARNLGIEAARGELIAFLDADDIWEPDHLATIAPLLEVHPEAVLASGAIRKFGARTGVWQAEAPVGEPFDAVRPVISKVAHPVPSATIVPRAVLRAAGGFDTDRQIAEDYDLWMRLALKGPFIYSDRVSVRYRCHPEQITVRRDHTVAAAYRARGKLLAYGPRERPDLARQLFSDVQAVWHQEMFGAWTAGDGEAGKRLWRLGSELGLDRGARVVAWRALWLAFPAVDALKRTFPSALRRRIGRALFGAGQRPQG